MKCTKRGPRPPLLRKKGAPANFLRGSRQIFDTENTDRVFLRYRYGKYQENYQPIPTDTDRKIPIRDTTLLTSQHFDDDTNILLSAIIAPSFESTSPSLNIGADQDSLLTSSCMQDFIASYHPMLRCFFCSVPTRSVFDSARLCLFPSFR